MFIVINSTFLQTNRVTARIDSLNNTYLFLDLSAAFDIVNISLLIKRLKIIGLPSDLIRLIRVWLENRSYYVSINGENPFFSQNVQRGSKYRTSPVFKWQKVVLSLNSRIQEEQHVDSTCTMRADRQTITETNKQNKFRSQIHKMSTKLNNRLFGPDG